MTEKYILSLTKVGDLYSNDPTKCKAEYRNLAQQWHPDKTGYDSSLVFQKIKELYEQALLMFEKGCWEKTNYVEMKTKTGSTFSINYLYTSSFELGTQFICKKYIIYILNKEKEKFYQKMKESLSLIQYKDDKMKKEFQRYFPKIVCEQKTEDGDFIVVFEKSEDLLPLSLVLQYFKEEVPEKHVAWIISRLMNISCFLNFSHIVHNGIAIENCFISPESHSVSLLGGWWYATPVGKSMIGTTSEIYNIMSVASKGTKISSYVTDLESIKLIGRKILGEINCRKFKEKKLPSTIKDFLITGSTESAFKELNKWDAALNSAYGPRKFTVLDLTAKQIYKN